MEPPLRYINVFLDDLLDGYIVLFSRGTMNGPWEVPHGDAHHLC